MVSLLPSTSLTSTTNRFNRLRLDSSPTLRYLDPNRLASPFLSGVNDNIFFMISSYFSITDCVSISCSSKSLKGRAELFSWRSIAIQMGLTEELISSGYRQTIQNLIKEDVLAYLIGRSTKTVEQVLGSESLTSMPQGKFEIFIKMAAKLSQTKFSEVFSSKIRDVYLFHTLLHPDYILKVQTILTHFSSEKLNFLFNQKTGDGLTFLHIACRYDKSDFMMFILRCIPDTHLKSCLNALTKEKVSPLLYAVENKFDNSLLAIIGHAKMKGELDLLLKQKYGETSLNFMQYLCVYGRANTVTAILNVLSSEERIWVLIDNNHYDQPPLLAALNNESKTFHAILDLVPDFLFLTHKTTGRTFLHEVCFAGVYEVFDHIDHYLISKKKDLKSTWTKLFAPKDNLNDAPPLMYLSQFENASDQPNQAIFVLKEIEKRFSKEECLELVKDAELLLVALSNGALELASYLLLKYSSLSKSKIRNKKKNIWHQLAFTPEHSLKERERVIFFEKHCSHCTDIHNQLNELDDAGNTPLSLAYQSGLNELAECYIRAGALPSIHMAIYSTKLLANHWSIKGDVFFKTNKYELEVWHSACALKEIFRSLKEFSLTHTDLKDLIEAFSIFDLPIVRQLPAMKARAAQNKVWIKPLSIRLGKDLHIVTIIGSSKLVLFFNRAPYDIQFAGNVSRIPACITSFVPPPGFCFDTILSWKDNHFFSPFDIMLDFLSKFKMLSRYHLRQQRTGNCTFASNEGAVFAYMALSKIQQSDAEITNELLQQTLDLVKPRYQEWKSINRWKQLTLHRDVADKELVAAIESLAFVRFAQKILRYPTNIIVSLTKDDPAFFPLRHYEWENLTDDQQAFFNHLSQTGERHRFIRNLVSFGQTWLNTRLVEFIREKNLSTLQPFVEYINREITISQSCT